MKRINLSVLLILALLGSLLISCAGQETAVPPEPTAEETEEAVEPTEAPPEPTEAPPEPTDTPEAEPEEEEEMTEAEPPPVPDDAEPYVDHLFTTVEEYEAASGRTLDSFGESPMLAEMVDAGDLPPVEARLPTDVAVVRPRDEIGTYGGTMNLLGFYEGAGAYSQHTENMPQSMLMRDPAYTTFYANVAKDWEVSEDNQSLTFYLREGMKWSDGEDFNADDFAFWYENILTDPDMTPTIEDQWKPGGEVMGFSKVDDYTVEYTFAVPYYRAVEVFSGATPFAPEHFLRQYLPEFNDDAEALAEEEGFESWEQAAQYHMGVANDTYDRDLKQPVINPYIVKELGADAVVWERNPYYWRVDTAGNQLPYIDTLLVLMVEDVSQAGSIRSMAGEIDFNESGLTLANFPVLKQNEEEGDYTVYRWLNGVSSNAMGVLPNYTHKDPEIREIFNDLRFRMALSHAINREEISENIFLGLTEPFVAAAGSLWTGYEEGMGEKYSEYDVAKANALLDEMGLEWDEAEEVRLTPSGEPLSLLLEWETEWHAYSEDWLDLITLYWEEIGIDVETKFTSEEALQTRFVANEIDMTNVTAAGGSEVVARANYPIRLMPPWHWGSTSCCPGSAYPWRRWLDTGGDEGIEPPDDVKRIYDLVQQWLNTPYGTEEYESLINEVIRINVDNLYFIGSVTAPPRIMVITNRMANVPREDGVWGSEVFSPYLIEQFYISE